MSFSSIPILVVFIFSIAARSSSQELLHRIGRLLASTRQPLGRQCRPVVNDRDDPARSLVLYQDVDKLPRGHFARDLGKTNGRIELALQVETNPGSVGGIFGIRVLGVLDKVPASLPVATVVLSVKLEFCSVFESDLRMLLNNGGSLVEDAVGAHFGGDQFLCDKVGAGAGKAKDSRPHCEAAGGRDFLAGGQDDFLRVVTVVVVVFWSFLLAAKEPQSYGRNYGSHDLFRYIVLGKTQSSISVEKGP
eukprot:CAMPEP_0197272508 /NCGR_PEP_ID=MMETSP1432-20130617/10037_1 /TAXON_ID=44447 /ORGANISM="Pseudo-nitzschia delicatissima, Strain UNC1205" /LENGTH=247 /DNA_ID=CAMNT_0042738069 /DNA_START=201 /DNA_END=944 /DNA_ORIENTATION=+